MVKEIAERAKLSVGGFYARFPNKDGIGHHVYSFSTAKTFELPLSETESSMTVTFDQPGIVTIGCNIHDWMVGYINIVNTPYYGKTDAAGNVVRDENDEPILEQAYDVSTGTVLTINTKTKKLNRKRMY